MESTNTSPVTVIGALASSWGIIGFFTLMIMAIVKLTAIALVAFNQPFSPMQWLIFIVSIVFMAYSEGYKGFQKSYSPRFAARAHYLSSQASWLQLILAPLFCMSFFHAPKRRVISSVLLTIMIVIFVLTFRLLPQPWRGILDASVVVGLSWGVVATAICCYQEFTNSSVITDPDLY